MPVTTITSNESIDIELPFKIKAGPGAGKTHWLVNHIKQVLATSKRMGSYRKIACITYTNTAVDTIKGRLDTGIDRVEISTIHSFIYQNIIRPYMHFVADEYEFKVKYMDGHDDHIVSRKYLKEWIDGHPNLFQLRNPWTPNQLLQRENNFKALKNWIASIDYQFNEVDLEIAIDNSKAFDSGSSTRLSKPNCLDHLSPGLLDYKKIFWRKGWLHHEDVLFFGYQLIRKYPFIITVLQAKFPYFFIDEFQDTSPVQTAIVRLLAQRETIVGVIGDKAQAIYGFQGAAVDDFEQFSLPGQQEFVIEDNRRSTDKIVDVLNHLREDISQNPLRAEPGEKPIIFVGAKEQAFAQAQAICGTEILVTLSRDNVTVNAMKRLYNVTIPTVNLLDKLYDKDNADRVKVIVRSIRAVALGVEKNFKEAIKEMEKNFSHIADKGQRRKTAFTQLSMLLSSRNSFEHEPLFKFYELVKASISPGMPTLSRGAIKEFYDQHSYQHVDFVKSNPCLSFQAGHPTHCSALANPSHR
jgi:DNA helicase-2/ATP-dependent DNA helicase PcrA